MRCIDNSIPWAGVELDFCVATARVGVCLTISGKICALGHQQKCRLQRVQIARWKAICLKNLGSLKAFCTRRYLRPRLAVASALKRPFEYIDLFASFRQTGAFQANRRQSCS